MEKPPVASGSRPGTSSSSISSKYDDDIELTAAQPQQQQQQRTPRIQYPKKPVTTFSLVFNMAGIDADVASHPYPGEGTPESPYIIDFLPGHDTRNPLQYDQWRKWTITILQAMATLAVAFVSTAYSGGIIEVIKSFHVSMTVAILGISMFVCGFAVGPLLWAPLSGLFARLCFILPIGWLLTVT